MLTLVIEKERCIFFFVMVTWGYLEKVIWQLEHGDAVMTFNSLHRLVLAYLQSKFVVRCDVHTLNTRLEQVRLYCYSEHLPANGL